MKMRFSIGRFKQSSRALICGLALVTAGAVHAASGTWTNGVDAPDNVWSAATNWLDNIIADGAGSTATLSNELAAPVTVSLDTPRTIGNLVFLLGAYTITNNDVDANVLTLAGPTKPLVLVPAATISTIRRTVLAGTSGFVLDGGGQLNLFKENTNVMNQLSGGIVLSNGTLQIQGITDGDNDANTLALFGAGPITFYNGTLNIQPAPNTTPSYGVVSNDFIVPEGGVGTVILPVRTEGSVGDGGAAGSGIGGNLTGSGTFNVVTRYVRGNVVGDWSAFSGQINITPGSAAAVDQDFRYGNTNGFPSAAVDLGGTTYFSFRPYRQLTGPTVFPIGVLSGANPAAVVVGSATAAQTLIYQVGARHTNATDTAILAASIVNGAGPAALVKEGAGRLQLTGANNYSGFTTINSGSLQIGDGSSDVGTIGTGPITNNGALIFAHGAGPLVVTAPIAGLGAITNSGSGGVLTLRGANTYTAPTVSTAGKLYIGTASKATGAYILQDSAEGFGTIMTGPGVTLTISGLSFSAASSFDFDLLTFGNPTAAVVTNTGNVALNGDITVNVAGPNIAVGTITLLQYNSRSGTGSFVLGTRPAQVTGATLNDDVANKRVTLTVTATFDSTLRWEGGAAGVWDVDNAANQIWRVVGSGQLTNYFDGAKVLFDDSATGTNFVNIQASVLPASITVNNTTKAYTFGGAGSINGAIGITKQGSNKLTLVGVNTTTGANYINAGTIEIGDGLADGSLGTGVITNNGTLLLNLGVGPLTLANQIHGSGNVVQMGIGQVNLSGANTYSGGLTVRPGSILGNNNGNAAGIGGGMRVEDATVILGGAGINNNVGELVIVTNAIFQNTGGNQNIDVVIRGTNVTITFDKVTLITMNRDISTLSGVITNRGAGTLRFNSGGGNNATGATNVLWVLETAGNFLQPRNASVNSLGAITGVGTIAENTTAGGANSVTWVVGGLNTSTTFEGVINDGLSRATPTPRFTGLTKVGTGTLTMNNATLTYRGSTVVSNGTLALVGTSAIDLSTNVVVAAPGVLNVVARENGTLTLGAGTTNQPLRGDGTITGNLVLGSRGRLEPGFSVGTLTVSGSATLGGTNVMELTTTGGAASDRLVAAGINYGGGTLILTNLGNLTGTNVFQLFSGGISGAFANVITQNLSGVTWNLSQLNVDGTITVVGPAGVSTTPTNITASVSGNQLDLQWPESHTGWELQTNAVSITSPNSWFVYPPSLTTNRVVLTIDPTKPNVYYRLHLQFTP